MSIKAPNSKVIEKRKTNKVAQAQYNQNVLGYRSERSRHRLLIDTKKRVSIIYDHVVH